MVAIKLKLSSSNASASSTNGQSRAISNTGQPDSGAQGQNQPNEAGPSAGHAVAGPSTAVGTPRSSHAHSTRTSAAGTPHSNGTNGTDTPSTGKRKKGATAAKGTTSRKSLGASPAQGQYSNKRQKRDVPTTPASSAHAYARPSAIPPHVFSENPTPTSSGSTSPSVMAPPPLPSLSPDQASSPLPWSPTAEGPYSPPAASAGAAGTAYSPGTGTPATPSGSDMWIKDEPFDGASADVDMAAPSPDPLSMPMTPADESSLPSRGRTGGKVHRVKKPFKVLAEKVLEVLNKKDEYALFGKPVDTNEYKDYLQVIGGPDNAMDLSTMAQKLEDGEYRSMNHLEADLRKLVTAAETYNPPGSAPHASAGRMLQIGLKQMDKFRPAVITPSPSPPRQASTPWRGQSVVSGREATQPPQLAALNEDGSAVLSPKSYIPIEMLAYPPNSLQGRAVAWSVTGGKRVYAKREIRARERFAGKWRRWGVDGSREVEDMDDLDELFYASRLDAPFGSNPYTMANRTVETLKGTDPAMWDWPGFGGTMGQPPVPFTQFPLRPRPATRLLGPLDFGLAATLERELQSAKARPLLDDTGAPVMSAQDSASGPPEAGEGEGEERKVPLTWGSTSNDADIIDRLFDDAMSTRREPFPDRPWHEHYIEREGLTSSDWLREMMGGLKAQAYLRSKQAFIDGALESLLQEQRQVKVGAKAGKPVAEAEGQADNGEALKPGIEELKRRADAVQQDLSIGGEVRRTVHATLEALQRLPPPNSVKGAGSSTPAPADGSDHAKSEVPTLTPATSGMLASESLLKRVKQAQHRAALRYILQPSDNLDFAPLFRRQEEFSRNGRQAVEGLDKTGKWIAQAITTVNGALVEQLEKEKDTKAGDKVEDSGADSGPSTLPPASDAPRQAGAIARSIDPYARTLQLLEQVAPDPADLDIVTAGADDRVVPIHRVGAVCKQYPRLGSASKRPLPTTPPPAIAPGTVGIPPAPVPKQMFPVDLSLLRLEMVTLAKHYALPGVKLFKKADAVRLLPPGIHKFLAEGHQEAPPAAGNK